MKKKILVVTQYFHPEQFRVNDLCAELVKLGYGVTVLTGIPNYPDGKFYPGYGLFSRRREIHNQIEIIRLPLIPRGNSPVMLALNYLSFVASGALFSLFSRLKADLVFIYEVSPMTQALPGVWFARRLRIPCVLYVTDLWPENVEVLSGIRSKTLLGLIGGMVDYIYRRCNKILVSSRSYITALRERGVSHERIIFWPQYAEDFYRPIPKTEAGTEMIPCDTRFNIVFTGNIGRAQGLGVLPRTARLLKENGIAVRFNIVGDGRAKAELIEAVSAAGVEEYFNFIPKQPARRIPSLLAACDAALICLAKNKIFAMTLPAKLQSYLACGVPVIACADGEVAAAIEAAGAGFAAPADDAAGLAGIIAKMCAMGRDQLSAFGENGLRYYHRHFERQKLLAQVNELFLREMGDDLGVC